MKGIYLFLVLFLVSCAAKRTDLVEFGYGHSYRLAEGEKLGVVDKDVIKDYEEVINRYPELQIPINKLIVSKNYQIFIGVCLNDKIPALRKAFALDTTSKIIRANGDRYFSKKSDRFIFRILHDNKNFSPYCISVISKDSSFVDSSYQLKNGVMSRFSFYE